MAHAVFAITLVISVVFAHGGACAALEFSEAAAHHALIEGTGVATAHGTHLDDSEHSAWCLHRHLPARHHHGTEQDCSAITPGGTPTPVALLAVVSVSAARPAAQVPHSLAGADRLNAAYRENLCVMRI